MFTGPRAVLLGILFVGMLFGSRATAQELCNPADPCGGEGIALYSPQGAPAGEDALRSEEAANAPADPVARKPARRIPAMSARRTSILLTLFLASQMNSPSFKVVAATAPQAGSTLGLLPGVVVANGSRLKPASLERPRFARATGSSRHAALILRDSLISH